jgi:cell volume regulation protein A
MLPIDRLILLAGLLALVGILSSKLSARIGLPVLVVFLAVGMLAGSEGPGGIPFENYPLTHGIGTLALVLILFDGGLRTRRSALKAVWGPGLALATVGVLVTAIVTGLLATVLLDVTLMEGFLLGSIVGSTDAAAVFSVFRARGANVPERITATLEVESGLNDPMAIFLTVGLLEILTGELEWGLEFAGLFAIQMSIGAIVGWLVGRIGSVVVERIDLSSAGLYPILVATVGLLAYGLAGSFGGSGFLAVYLAGIVLGNREIVFKRGVLLFHDGLAWLAQLVMFVIMGLLVFPSRLASVAGQGLLLSAVLIFVARPLAVGASLLPFRFRWRELLFISWVGLRGAVPIVLAIYPLLFGLSTGSYLFNIVFFVVLVSAVTQGWTLPTLARLLGLQEPSSPTPPLSLELTSLRHVEGDIVEYTVTPESQACGHLIRELALPDGAVVSLIARRRQVIPPRGSTRIEAGDFVFVVLRPGVQGLVDRVFSADSAATELPSLLEFPLRGRTTLAEIEEFYGIRLGGAGEETLDELLRARLGKDLQLGKSVVSEGVTLYVREMDGDRVERVGLALPAPDEPPMSRQT